MSGDHASHRDAELILKLYELRREPVMREARSKMFKEFQPKSVEDVQAVMKPDHPLNTAYRMVPDRREAIHQAVAAVAAAPDVDRWAVLVAGKGHEEFQVVGSEVIPFSDPEELRSAILAHRPNTPEVSRG